MFRPSSKLLLALALCAGLFPQALGEEAADAAAQVAKAEALHLDEKYPAALQAYDRLIAEHPAWLRPRYLRWILLVDMGALSILHRELGLDADLPFERSLDAAMARLPRSLRDGEKDARAWLAQVALRYYEIKPTHVANRGDMDLAVKLARRALDAPGLPKQLAHELRENLVVYLGDAPAFKSSLTHSGSLTWAA